MPDEYYVVSEAELTAALEAAREHATAAPDPAFTAGVNEGAEFVERYLRYIADQ